MSTHDSPHSGSNGLLAPTQRSIKATLVVVAGKATRPDLPLKLPAIIGRGQNATILVGHPTVSRSHCKVIERDGALVVRDMNSKNGTFVGEARIVEAVLKPGDQLTVGPLTFRVDYEPRGEDTSIGRAKPVAVGQSEPNKDLTDDDIDLFLNFEEP